jgi:hypothetical protein
MIAYKVRQVPVAGSEVVPAVSLAIARSRLNGISPQRLLRLVLGGEVRAVSEPGGPLRFVEQDVDQLAVRLKDMVAN